MLLRMNLAVQKYSGKQNSNGAEKWQRSGRQMAEKWHVQKWKFQKNLEIPSLKICNFSGNQARQKITIVSPGFVKNETVG